MLRVGVPGGVGVREGAPRLSRVLQGDLGRSMISNSAVVDELANTVGPTMELMAASLIWAIPLGILFGTLAAVRRGKISDRIIMAASVAGVSMPIFWFGLIPAMVVLFICGGAPAEEPYVMLSQIATAYYFLHFLVILPIVGQIEKSEPLPYSITEAVLGSDKKAVLGENTTPAV